MFTEIQALIQFSCNIELYFNQLSILIQLSFDSPAYSIALHEVLKKRMVSRTYKYGP